MIFSVVLAFGDSLTYGARDENRKSYPQYLAESYFQETGHPLVYANEGVNSDTIADMCRRVYPVCLKYPEASEVLFFAGTNDTKPGIRTDPKSFGRMLRYILNVFTVHGKFTYVATNPGLKGFGSQEYDAEGASALLDLNNVVRETFHLHGRDGGMVRGVEMEDLSEDPTLFADGCHMNSKGYQAIAERFKAAIAERRNYGGE